MKRAVPKSNDHDAAREPGVLLSAMNGNGGHSESGPEAAPDEDSQVLRSTGEEVELGNALQAYLRDIRRTPLLTPQQEFDTAVKARAGDFDA
eukprot:gene46633-57109_t